MRVAIDYQDRSMTAEQRRWRYNQRDGVPSIHRIHLPSDPLRPILIGDDGQVSADLAHRCGLKVDTAYQILRRGTLPLLSADRIACKMGTHPSTIWGQLWWEATE